MHQLSLTNEEDIQWLQAMTSDERRHETLRHCVTIGRLAMENYQVRVGSGGTAAATAELERSVESITEVHNLLSKQLDKSNATMFDALRAQGSLAEKLIEPIVSRMERMNETVEGIFNIKGTSNVKGKFGENLIAQHVQTVFPHYDVQNMSNTAHEADFHIGTDYGTVLLEVKTYTASVNKEQMDKFYRDIDRTSAPFAIFLSTTSGIVGKKYIEWEIYGKSNTIVLFFPNSTLAQQGVVFSLLFMKALAAAEINKEASAEVSFYKKSSARDVGALLETFDEFYQKLVLIMEKNGKLRYDIGACKVQIDKMLDEIYKQSFDLELQQKAALETMYGAIKDKLQLHSSGGGRALDAYQWLSDSTEYHAWVTTLGLKPALTLALHHLYDCTTAQIPALKVCCDKTLPRCHFVANSQILASCHVAKTKIDVIFDISNDDHHTPVTLHPQFEALKNNEITVSVHTNLTSGCYALICQRLGGQEKQHQPQQQQQQPKQDEPKQDEPLGKKPKLI